MLGARGVRNTELSSVGFRCANMVIDRGPTDPDSHRVQGTPQFTTSPDPGIVGMSLFGVVKGGLVTPPDSSPGTRIIEMLNFHTCHEL